MDRQAIVSGIRARGVVAIVRAEIDAEDFVRTVEAVAKGGITCVEITLTSRHALAGIEAVAARLEGLDLLLGAGSVLDEESCRLAILAGAQYIVSPVVAPRVIAMAHRYGKTALPGAFTPTEIFAAWEAGGDLIKVFPATLGGLEYIKAVRAPLPQIPLVPTGGVSVENMKSFVDAGVAAIGAGNGLVRPDLVKARDFAGLTESARRFAEAWRAARG